MSQWYYVEGTERVGPVNPEILREHLANGDLNLESYVWRKGFSNWVKIKEVDELSQWLENHSASGDAEDNRTSQTKYHEREKRNTHSQAQSGSGAQFFYDKDIAVVSIPPKSVDLEKISQYDREFYIKIGEDRKQTFEVEFGPYSLSDLTEMYANDRINEKTYILTLDQTKWIPLANHPLAKKMTDKKLLKSSLNTNDPVLLTMSFDDSVSYGVMKDISIGGGIYLTTDVIPLKSKIDGQISWGHRAPVGVKILIVRPIEDHSGYVVRFLTLTQPLRSLVENIYQLE